MKDPLVELVPAYYTLLNGVLPVYDVMMPEDKTDTQYIILGEKIAREVDGKTQDQTECIMLVEIVCKSSGTGGKAARGFTNQVLQIINHDTVFSLSSFQVVTTKLLSNNSMSSITPTGKLFRVLLRFQHVVYQK